MIRVLVTALILGWVGDSVQASAPTGSDASSGTKKSRVIDLGQLEIEGELRRPPVNWVGNYKGMRELLPILYAAEFERLESEVVTGQGGDAALRAVKMTSLPQELRPTVEGKALQKKEKTMSPKAAKKSRQQDQEDSSPAVRKK